MQKRFAAEIVKVMDNLKKVNCLCDYFSIEEEFEKAVNKFDVEAWKK